jgi:hypothetical protein
VAPDTALLRTRSAPLRSPLNINTFGLDETGWTPLAQRGHQVEPGDAE